MLIFFYIHSAIIRYDNQNYFNVRKLLFLLNIFTNTFQIVHNHRPILNINATLIRYDKTIHYSENT